MKKLFAIGLFLMVILALGVNAIADVSLSTSSLAINENMSVSYGVSDVDFETASLADETSSGVSASYTMGGMTFAAVMNQTDSVAGSSGTDKEFKEISVAFAF